MRVLAGRNPHHIVEAQFKAVARALRDAAAPDPRARGDPQHQGHAVSRRRRGSWCSTTARATCARPSGRWQRAGADAEVTADADAALDADGLVVPGVGAFAACMAGLRAVGGDEVIAQAAGRRRGRCSGICVGMQVLFEAGDEHGERTAGLRRAGPASVERLDAPVLPHMGWNTVRAAGRLARCSPGSAASSGSTSCTPTRATQLPLPRRRR